VETLEDSENKEEEEEEVNSGPEVVVEENEQNVEEDQDEEEENLMTKTETNKTEEEDDNKTEEVEENESEEKVFIPPPPSEPHPEPEPEPEPEPDPEQERLEGLEFNDVTDDDIASMTEKLMVEKLVEGLEKSEQVPEQRKYLQALFKVITQNAVSQLRFVRTGGLQIVIEIINAQLENGGNLLFEAIHFIGELSANAQLKSVLLMQNIVGLMVQGLRKNKDDSKVLDSCLFCLANVAYDSAATVTYLIEMGAVDDVFEIIGNHEKNAFVIRSSMDLLSNLMHESHANRILIASHCDVILNVLTKYGSEDSDLAQKCLRTLGNLAYVPENVQKLEENGIIPAIVQCVKENHDEEDVLQMAAAVLSNLASDAQVSERMIKEGVIETILSISTSFPDLIELQKSCLGCMGNLANNAQNRYTMIDKKCALRILEVLSRLHFDDTIIRLSLSLVKILAISAEVSTQFLRDGLANTITRIVQENLKKDEILRMCCQALCKCIVNTECSEIAGSHGVHDALCDVAKEGTNCYNAPLMIDIMKVFQNMGTIEGNAQRIARYASVPVLRGMESLKDNQIYMNVSATLVGNLAVYESASKHIVKRGGCAVLAHCIQSNVEYQATLSKLLRCISNLVLTETKSYELFVELEMETMIDRIQALYPKHPQIQKNSMGFLRAMDMKSKKLAQSPRGMQSLALKDKMHVKYVKFLISGAMMKKFSTTVKPRKRIVKLTDDLEYIILKDPSGKKEPKQIYVRDITEMRVGACTPALTRGGLGWKRAKNERSFAIFIRDGSGGSKPILNLEIKTVELHQKWTAALQQLIIAAQEKEPAHHGSGTFVFE